MGGIGTTPQPQTPAGELGPSYTPDGARRMPVANSPASQEAARRRRRIMTGRSGRTSTQLAGTASYVNSFLGDT